MIKSVVQAIFDTIKGLIYWLKTVVQGGVKRLSVVQNAERCANSFAQRYLIDISILIDNVFISVVQSWLRPLCIVQRYIYRYTFACVTVVRSNCVKTFGGLGDE